MWKRMCAKCGEQYITKSVDNHLNGCDRSDVILRRGDHQGTCGSCEALMQATSKEEMEELIASFRRFKTEGLKRTKGCDSSESSTSDGDRAEGDTSQGRDSLKTEGEQSEESEDSEEEELCDTPLEKDIDMTDVDNSDATDPEEPSSPWVQPEVEMSDSGDSELDLQGEQDPVSPNVLDALQTETDDETEEEMVDVVVNWTEHNEDPFFY
ncbi:hypothetical protein NKR19_g10122 [Coniochaeta hoffmannii]|uniref:Uncharacterized protein n=1 Tax=Coniochaeta hoffmannii TaxID=91930 RepID=A0AA38R7M3_9PEZI|nr:hypothetical protein NKR19_g10122 [Coniochaeta hoffmannii]